MSFVRQAVRSTRAVRSYASEAKQASVRPPIQLHGLSGKYAGALYSAAAKKDALKQVETDLKAVHSAIRAESSIQDFLSNPVLSSSDKSAGIAEMLKKASPKGNSSEVTKNFFEVLAENGRLYQASKTIEDFLEIMTAHRGEVKVTITTATPLEKDLQKRVEDALKGAQAAQGKTLVFENKVNPGVQGGLIVDLGDKTIDLSTQSRVQRLNTQLAEAI